MQIECFPEELKDSIDSASRQHVVNSDLAFAVYIREIVGESQVR